MVTETFEFYTIKYKDEDVFLTDGFLETEFIDKADRYETLGLAESQLSSVKDKEKYKIVKVKMSFEMTEEE